MQSLLSNVHGWKRGTQKGSYHDNLRRPRITNLTVNPHDITKFRTQLLFTPCPVLKKTTLEEQTEEGRKRRKRKRKSHILNLIVTRPGSSFRGRGSGKTRYRHLYCESIATKGCYVRRFMWFSSSKKKSEQEHESRPERNHWPATVVASDAFTTSLHNDDAVIVSSSLGEWGLQQCQSEIRRESGERPAESGIVTAIAASNEESLQNRPRSESQPL